MLDAPCRRRNQLTTWSKLRMEAASRLAPYQSPKLGVVMIQPTSEQDRLAQMTDEELIADLNRRADALGIEIILKPKARRQLTLVPNNKSEEVMDEPSRSYPSPPQMVGAAKPRSAWTLILPGHLPIAEQVVVEVAGRTCSGRTDTLPSL